MGSCVERRDQTMKPKYSIGEVVKIKATGEKVKIDDVRKWDSENIYWIKSKYIHSWYGESELAPYRPSRTGKYRNEKGQFISQYESYKELLKGGDAKLYTGLYKNKLDSKQRNYQKILTKLDVIEKKIDELGRKV